MVVAVASRDILSVKLGQDITSVSVNFSPITPRVLT